MAKNEYSLKQQAGYLSIGKLIAFFIQLITPIILVRIFNQTQYGVYQQILTISTLAVPLLSLSLPNSLYYFYPNSTEVKEKKSLMSQSFYIPAAYSFIILTIAFIFRDTLLKKVEVINTQEGILLYLIVLFIFFLSSSRLIEIIFVVEKKSKLAMIYFAVEKLVRLILLLTFVLIFKTLESALLALFMFSFIRFLVLYLYLKIKYKINPFKMDKGSIAKQFKYSLPMYLSSVIGKIGNHLDKLVLMILLSSDEFALYAVGNFRIPMIAILYTSIGNVVIQRLSNYSKTGNIEGTLSLWKKMVNKNALITIPVVIFFFIVANEFITLLFTEDYSMSANVFRITILVFFIQMLGYGYILRAYAKTSNVLYANLTRFAISLAIAFPLIKFFGIIGAAITFTASFSINGILQLARSKKLLNVKWKEFIPWKYLVKIFIISLIPIVPILVLQLLNLNMILFLCLSAVIYFSTILFIYVNRKLLDLKQLSAFIKI